MRRDSTGAATNLPVLDPRPKESPSVKSAALKIPVVSGAEAEKAPKSAMQPVPFYFQVKTNSQLARRCAHDAEAKSPSCRLFSCANYRREARRSLAATQCRRGADKLRQQPLEVRQRGASRHTDRQSRQGSWPEIQRRRSRQTAQTETDRQRRQTERQSRQADRKRRRSRQTGLHSGLPTQQGRQPQKAATAPSSH